MMNRYGCLISGMIGYTIGARMGVMRKCACKTARRMKRILKRKLGV